MKQGKNKFINRLQKVVGLNLKQSEAVYTMLLDDKLMPSREVVKTVEVVKEVPVEVVKTVEVIREIEVVKELSLIHI